MKINKTHPPNPSPPAQLTRNIPVTTHSPEHPSPSTPLTPSLASPVLDGHTDKSLPVLQQRGVGSRAGIQSLLSATNDDGQQVPPTWPLQHVGCTLLVGGHKAWEVERKKKITTWLTVFSSHFSPLSSSGEVLSIYLHSFPTLQ